ncbi:hypothetical protein DBR32_08675 [Taibaiella sp. KBW10]|uniref:DUF1003 domain-containing protein n=1 Tax=Taibaiella sp. KBW10 TaxID=2153357 RepID=UPI000F597856|nr:DUF1003 domain-containing protein [Taibaiella sp. KBW10]RQO30787.1 hypothetical protein DBR32_08675 [Taibaiella sp. KBW10]
MEQTFVSDISATSFPLSERVGAHAISVGLFNEIVKDHPKFNHNSVLSLEELNTYRMKYIATYFSKEEDVLSEMEQKVMDTLGDDTTITNKIDDEENETVMTYGQRVADKVASFGGSWTFIISFGIFILIWILLNIYLLSNKGFDPYPFILLNLILSCIASLQAPVIMMSQNRQEEKDRARAKKDYMINLKAEIELRALHEKIDHLIIHQQQELLEIQRVQIEMMNDILEKIGPKSATEA